MKCFTSLGKRTFWISLFCMALILFPLASQALKVQDVPNPRQHYGGWVTDMAQLLSSQAETQINQIISELEAKNGTEIAVVTVPDTAPYTSPKEFTTQLFNSWGIGKQRQDNGVVLMVSKRDRRVEIETGYGMETILPDAKVGNIIARQIVPRFQQGDFEAGILAGTQALVNNIAAHDALFPSDNRDRPWFSYIPNYIWFTGILGLTWTLIVFIWLLLMANRALHLEPQARVKVSKDYALIASQRLSVQKAYAYEQFTLKQQLLLVKRYLWILLLSISVVLVTAAYLTKWSFLVMDWSVWRLVGVSFVIVFLLTGVGFLMSKIYGFFRLGLSISWGLLAIDLSGQDLEISTILLVLLVILFVSLLVDSINLEEDESNNKNSGCFTAFFALIIWALIAMNLNGGNLGTFTILLVLPMIYFVYLLIKKATGSGAPWYIFALLLAGFSVTENFWLSFPNLIIIPLFIGINSFLILTLFCTPEKVRLILKKLGRSLGLVRRTDILFPCKKCGSSMEMLSEEDLKNYLEPFQQQALELGSVQFFAWKCGQCQPHLTFPGIHLWSYPTEEKESILVKLWNWLGELFSSDDSDSSSSGSSSSNRSSSSHSEFGGGQSGGGGAGDNW